MYSQTCLGLQCRRRALLQGMLGSKHQFDSVWSLEGCERRWCVSQSQTPQCNFARRRRRIPKNLPWSNEKHDAETNKKMHFCNRHPHSEHLNAGMPIASKPYQTIPLDHAAYASALVYLSVSSAFMHLCWCISGPSAGRVIVSPTDHQCACTKTWAMDRAPPTLSCNAFIEGSLEVKLPTIWADESRDGKSQREEKSRREKSRREKTQVREKVGKSRITVFFQWFVAPEGRKVGSLKRRVRSHLAKWEMKNCTQLWRQAHFQVKMYKAPHARATFGNWDVEKVHAIVARSTFRSQNVKNTRGSEHFWTFRCRFAWQAHGIVHLVKSEQNVRVL